MHFDLTCRFYTDINASKAFGFGAIVYYVKDNDSNSAIADYSDNSKPLAATIRTTYSKKFSIKPIMFLSRWLLLVEH